MSDKPIVQEFLRYEFKYILSQEIRDKVEKEIGHFMNYDGYIHDELDNAYFVRSLYFDGPNSFNFYEKIDGIKKRKKFRLRTYVERLDSLQYLSSKKGVMRIESSNIDLKLNLINMKRSSAINLLIF